MCSLQLLKEEDQEALEDFLCQYPDTSMFLRSNLLRGGIINRGQSFQGDYFGKWEEGKIIATITQDWKNRLHLQAGNESLSFLEGLTKLLKRPINGLLGSLDQVAGARNFWKLEQKETTIDFQEDLYSLDLSDLVVPKALKTGSVICRLSEPKELDLLAQWRIAYDVEANGIKETDKVRKSCEETIQDLHQRKTLWVLEDKRTLKAMTAFNARVPDCAQIGGVYTPPEFRGNGFARCVIAQSLLDAQTEGSKRSVLFTENPNASRAYEALGFKKVGKFGVVFFKEAQDVNRSASE